MLGRPRHIRPVLFAVALAFCVLGCGKRKREEQARPAAAAGPTDADVHGPDGGRSHRDVVTQLLETGNVDIYLDPRKPDVIAPPHLMAGPRLILKFGRAMAVPIPDLRVSGAGISGTLSFDQQAFFCSIPWSAVFAVVGEDGRGWVWDDRVPIELRDASAPDAESAR
jgi:hypothetical protein